MLIVLLCISVSKPPSSSNTILDKLVNTEEVKNIISPAGGLVIARSAYCDEGCPDVLESLASRLDVRIYRKEELFMRQISNFLEIIEYEAVSIRVFVHHGGSKKELEIR